MQKLEEIKFKLKLQQHHLEEANKLSAEIVKMISKLENSSAPEKVQEGGADNMEIIEDRNRKAYTAEEDAQILALRPELGHKQISRFQYRALGQKLGREWRSIQTRKCNLERGKTSQKSSKNNVTKIA